MTRAAIQALLGAALVLTLLALAGCKRDQGPPAVQSVDGIYTDAETGCQYFARVLSGHRYEPFTPRIAADGKAHMGCRITQP